MGKSATQHSSIGVCMQMVLTVPRAIESSSNHGAEALGIAIFASLVWRCTADNLSLWYAGECCAGITVVLGHICAAG